jgi:hypothetical protein
MPEVLQFFVSTPPPEKRPYYKRDVLNLCCDPAEETATLAYQERWVSQDVIGRVGDSRGLKSFPAQVIFCEHKPLGNKAYEFHPIRHAVATCSPLPNQKLFTFELVLGLFADQAAFNPATMNQALQAIPDHPNQTPVDGKTGSGAKFVRIVNENTFDIGKTDDWEALVRTFAKLQGLKDCLFFTCVDREATHRPICFPGSRRERAAPRWNVFHERTLPRSSYWRELKAVRGRSREVFVYGIAGSEAAFASPEMSVRDAVATVSGPLVRQHQAGFLSYYRVDFRGGWDTETSLLKIAVARDSEDKNGLINFRGPEVVVHVVSKASMWSTGLVVFLLTAGMAVSSGPEFFANALSLPTWVIKAVGIVSFALGGLIGFRKLPIKG